jgi:hypothetical protein
MSDQKGVTIVVNAETAAAVSKLNELFQSTQANAQKGVAGILGINGVLEKHLDLLKLVGGAVAAFVGFEGLRRAQDEYIKSARALAQLDAALRSTGQSTAAFREQLEEQRAAISKVTGADDEEVMAIQRQLVSHRASQAQIETLSLLILDLAAAMGTDAATAALEMGKALGGQDVQLRGVRLDIDRTLPKYEQINQLIRQLNTQIGGQARAAYSSAAPEVRNLSLAFQELEKTLGRIATQQTAPFLSLLTKALTKLKELLDSINSEHVSYGEAMGAGPMQKKIDPKLLQEVIDEAKKEADRVDALFSDKVRLLELQREAGESSGRLGGIQSAIETERAENELAYRTGEKSLADYLTRRKQLVMQAAFQEEKALRKSLEAITVEMGKKNEELAVLDQSEDTEENRAQYLSALAERNKLALQAAQVESQLSAAGFKGKTALTGESLFGFEHPTSLGGNMTLALKNLRDDFGTVAAQIAKTWKDVIGAAISSVGNAISGLIEGTMTWSQALRQIGTSVLNVVIQGLVNMFAAMVLGENSVAAAKLAKQAATLPGDLVGALVTAIGEGGWAAAALIAAAVAALGVGVAYAAGAFAEGGRPPVGELALVGERGPELFVPDRSGTILPANVTSTIMRGGNVGSAGNGDRSSNYPPEVHINIFGDDKTALRNHIRSNPHVQHEIIDVVEKHHYRLQR